MSTLPPRSRRTDPISSHRAGEDMEASGKSTTQRRMVLRAVKEWPGRTARELAIMTRLDRYMLSRRLPELCFHGKVRNGDMRKCFDGGRLSQTWYPE